MDGCDMTRYRG